MDTHTPLDDASPQATSVVPSTIGSYLLLDSPLTSVMQLS